MVALRLAPEVVVTPALGAAPPPWRWSRPDMARSLLHHGVYAATAEGSTDCCAACPSRRNCCRIGVGFLSTEGRSRIGLNWALDRSDHSA
jgi:hypothetical protein